MSIVLRDVTFAYGNRQILDRFSCHFDRGAMTALVGPSGSGKSTVIALVLGMLRPSAGDISYSPTVVRSDGSLDLGRVAWMMQTANLFPRRRALDNVALPLHCAGVAAATDRASAALADVGLVDRQHDVCGRLSGGERQRVAAARALAAGAPVLIADEPTVSLDRANRDLLVSALVTVARRGAVVIVATHDPAVYEACDAVVAL